MNNDEIPYEIIQHYRHNKAGKCLVRCPSRNGLKTRAARLINCKGFGARYVGRDKGYVLSQSALKRFAEAYGAGKDGNVITCEIED